jgi:hypothetical protein
MNNKKMDKLTDEFNTKINIEYFDIDEYLNIIKKNILSILSRKSKEEIPFDILDSEKDNKYSLYALKIKQKQMKYGEIWQMVIGNYHKFIDLKTGHTSGLDILSTERKIIIELKNRYNTDNASSRKTNLDKLYKYKIKNTDYTCIYGIINDKTKLGIIKDIDHNNIIIKYYSGQKLFEYIFEENTDKIINYVKNVVSTFTENN